MAQNSKGAYLNVLQDADGKDVYPITRADGVYMNDGTTAQAKCEALDSKIDSTKSSLQTSFQAGVDGIYSAITAQGTTPVSKSQGDVKNAIKTLADAKYAAGHQGNAGTGDVLSGKTFSNSSGVNLTGTMANQGGYTASKSWARGDGTTYIRIPKGAYLTAANNGLDLPEVTVADNLYGQGEYNNNYNSGYNQGVTDADNRANSSSTNYKSGYNAGKASVVSKSINVTIPYQGDYGKSATTTYNVGHTIVAAGVKEVHFGGSHYDSTSGANGWHSSAYVGCTYSGTSFTVNCKTGTHAVGADNGEGYGADASGNITCTVSVAYYA